MGQVMTCWVAAAHGKWLTHVLAMAGRDSCTGNAANLTAGFAQTFGCRLCRGPYAIELIHAWEVRQMPPQQMVSPPPPPPKLPGPFLYMKPPSPGHSQLILPLISKGEADALFGSAIIILVIIFLGNQITESANCITAWQMLPVEVLSRTTSFQEIRLIA